MVFRLDDAHVDVRPKVLGTGIRRPRKVPFYTMNGITKVSFGTSTIQRSRRIALDPNLLTTLGLNEGDTVKVELDVGSATILISKDTGSATLRKGGTRRRNRV